MAGKSSSSSNPAWVTIVVAIIGLIGTLGAAYLGTLKGQHDNQQQVNATATQVQATAVAQQATVATLPLANPITQVAVTQVAVTQVAITQVAVTQVVITQIAAPEPTQQTPESDQPNGATAEPTNTSTESENYSYTVRDCKADSKTVTCSLFLRNKKDQNLPIEVREAHMYTPEGQEFAVAPENGKIGNKSLYEFRLPIPPKVNIEMKLTFTNVPEQTTQISLLELFIVSEGNIQLRDIPLQR